MLAGKAECQVVDQLLCIPFWTGTGTLLEEKDNAEAFDQPVGMFAGVFDALYDAYRD